MIVYKVSIVVADGSHPGAILNLHKKPEVGKSVEINGNKFISHRAHPTARQFPLSAPDLPAKITPNALSPSLPNINPSPSACSENWGAEDLPSKNLFQFLLCRRT